MKKRIFLLIVLSVLVLAPFLNAANDFGYNNLYKDNQIIDGLNYSINTNYSDNAGDSHLFDGYSSTGLYGYYKGLLETYFDGIYAKITDLANYLPLAGGTMSGDINMGSNNITNINSIEADGVDSYFNSTLLIDGNIANADATLVIQSDINKYSCINMTEGGSLGMQLCYDGSGGNRGFIISNMETNFEYFWIDREEGIIYFQNNSQSHGNITPSDTLTYDLGSAVKRWNNLYVADISADDVEVSGSVTADEYILGKNYVTQYHSNLTQIATTIDTWYNISWNVMIENETTSGYSLEDNNESVEFYYDGIIRVQGCTHPYNNNAGIQEAKILVRAVINGVEARCLQVSKTKAFKSSGVDILEYVGTINVYKGQKVQIQWRVDNTDIELRGDTDFDNPVSASLNLERISNIN